METLRTILSLTLVALAVPRLAAAQETLVDPGSDRGVVIVGLVVDQTTEEPLPNASVTVRFPVGEGPPNWGGVSDEAGEFVTDRLRVGTYDIRVEVLGFTTVDHQATFTHDGSVELRVEMVPEPFALQPVVATAVRESRLETNGFFERRKIGLGYSMTREEIEARGSSRVSELFHTVPGVRVLPARPGRAGDVRLRDNCVPMVVLDGSPISFPIAIDELLTVGDLEAIEVYHGATGPVQYLTSSCGMILAWTRDPRNVDGSPWSWRRLFVAVGLVGLLYLISPY